MNYENSSRLIWCAIGDSFTYLDAHQDETGGRLQKGYLTRTLEQLPYPVTILNLGKNGSQTSDWINVNFPSADLYTILLGTNDWFHNAVPGTQTDFLSARPGTVLGNLGLIIRHIRQVSPTAPVFVMNPVERGEFVYIYDHTNHAHSSDRPENDIWLRDLSATIFNSVQGENIIPVDLYTKSGFTPQNAVRFKRVLTNGLEMDLSYEDYCKLPEFDPQTDPYPYPPEAVYMTYDGLHPSDQGSQIIADILTKEFLNFFSL